MEWKVIVGQICCSVLGIVAMVLEVDHSVVSLVVGGLLASIGYPAVAAISETVSKRTG